jgi:hypothetical protein
MDLIVGDALCLYTICSILPDSSDFLLYKESLFLWFCIEPPDIHGAVRQSNTYETAGSGTLYLGLIDLRWSAGWKYLGLMITDLMREQETFM